MAVAIQTTRGAESAELHLIALLLAGDRRAAARAISIIENDAPGAEELGHALAAHLGRAHIIGVTGAPGAGKSTLINALLGELIARGKHIGVVAIDPSSPVTGGAVLGDRVRMGEHGKHPDVFIRSLSSRGHLGGVSRTTARIVDVLDAAGFDVVIVETVGTGQSEVEIADLTDTRVVVCPPGLGDGVQAIKAGILEIANVLVVNKSDLPSADATVRDLNEMLSLRRAASGKVAVLKTCATTGAGVQALADALLEHARVAGSARRLAASRALSAGHHTHAVSRARVHMNQQTEALDLIKRLAARDPFVRMLGITCVDGGLGNAAVSMTVRDEHLNFIGTCHGGVIFALADTVFGLAANSHGMIAPGIDAHITYHVAARPGDTLLATAVEVSRTRKLAVYRVDVARGGETLASFTGTVYLTARPNGGDPAPD